MAGDARSAVFLAQILLALAYTLLAHLASAYGDARFGVAALVALWLMLLLQPLAKGRMRAWGLLVLLLLGTAWLARAGLTEVPLLLVPVAFVAMISAWFARSLRPGRVPLITRIVAALDGTTPPQLAPALGDYARGLTRAWAWALAALAAFNLLLALIAVPDGLVARLGGHPPLAISAAQWSWLANIGTYGVLGGFFAIEYQVRKRRFPGRYHSFADFLRRMAGLGPAFWKDFLR
ncbi:ketosynthase [Luteimonas aquatica]|uniref:ketosynthase n=1 Tax=Luteimonas aquatica TaxID=450364 RepID=UPI001F58AE15|nr:ketosynthase [Luteimonas aquatica]